MKLHKKAVLPKGYKCTSVNCGLKPNKEERDLAIFLSEKSANAAAVFTQNQFPGAPIIVGREIIKNRKLSAIIVNSKISNVGTGEQGIENARLMGEYTASEFGVNTNEVLMSSTGVIAQPLPVELVKSGIPKLKDTLQLDPIDAVKGIMTTDTYPKAISANIDDATITVCAKGSGMIEPNMATMLVYILTDADIAAESLDEMLRKAVDVSFNMLSVDSDTSTSDTCAIMANGLAGEVDTQQFYQLLEEMCIEMAKMLAEDGEGATKLLVTKVTGALNDKEARIIAKSLVNSPLIKTMAYGADPNIGRVLMAVGKCFDCTIDTKKIKIYINGTEVYSNQERVDFDEANVRSLLSGKNVEISVDLGVGAATRTAYGCDYTEGYIEENAAYYSS
jgi:glutamate N-acetyltransferase/amino-acid N-acetyltransferase